jgi:hypothetical protein
MLRLTEMIFFVFLSYSYVFSISFDGMEWNAGEPQEECARCGKTFLMLVGGGGGGGSQVGSDVTGLCNDCSGGGDPADNDNDKEELDEDSDVGGMSDVSGDGDVDVDNDQD